MPVQCSTGYEAKASHSRVTCKVDTPERDKWLDGSGASPHCTAIDPFCGTQTVASNA